MRKNEKIVVILKEGWMIPGMIRHVSSDETAPPLRMIFLFEFPSPHHLFVAWNGWHSVKCRNRYLYIIISVHSFK